MNDLRKELAPLSDAAWAEIEDEAKQTLMRILAARKLVDFEGPLGWDVSAIGTGRTQALAAPARNVEARLRLSQPMMELRVPFELDLLEMECIARGAKDAELQPVKDAARLIAMTEDRAVFHGFADGRIEGICEAAAAEAVSLSTDYLQYPAAVVTALNKLRNAGVDGPYAIALGPQCYAGLTTTTTVGGYPVLEHVQRLLDGPIVWAPAVDGAAVLSLRGGDFELTVGQDLSIGYLSHTESSVRLYLQESLTFRVLSPEAAVPLVYA
ncbi:MAG: bacteriocin [Rhodospirillales bacterium]|nr:MAG: bacteriocin [Rhodospirillales bacterium]